MSQYTYTFNWTIEDFHAKCESNSNLNSNIFYPFGNNQLALYLWAKMYNSPDISTYIDDDCLIVNLVVANSTPLNSEWNFCINATAEEKETMLFNADEGGGKAFNTACLMFVNY